MKMKIYDYDNKVKEIELPDDKHVEAIFVSVVSGDETGYVVFEEGGVIQFDASDDRMMSFNDGNYIVEGDDVATWLAWEPSRDDYTYSYARQMAFDKW